MINRFLIYQNAKNQAAVMRKFFGIIVRSATLVVDL
jgi:hypothetical protein